MNGINNFPHTKASVDAGALRRARCFHEGGKMFPLKASVLMMLHNLSRAKATHGHKQPPICLSPPWASTSANEFQNKDEKSPCAFLCHHAIAAIKPAAADPDAIALRRHRR